MRTFARTSTSKSSLASAKSALCPSTTATASGCLRLRHSFEMCFFRSLFTIRRRVCSSSTRRRLRRLLTTMTSERGARSCTQVDSCVVFASSLASIPKALLSRTSLTRRTEPFQTTRHTWQHVLPRRPARPPPAHARIPLSIRSPTRVRVPRAWTATLTSLWTLTPRLNQHLSRKRR